MLQPGLVSITFRQLTPAEIIDWAIQARLKGIEWGGDAHVPPGNVALAKDVARQTREAGLEVAAYGSYYALAKDKQAPFEPVLDSAVALDTSIIRIWPGRIASAEADEAARQRRGDVCNEEREKPARPLLRQLNFLRLPSCLSIAWLGCFIYPCSYCVCKTLRVDIALRYRGRMVICSQNFHGHCKT